MTAITTPERRLSATLLALRLLVFGVFLFWACDKIFNAEQAARIFEVYFSLSVPPATVPLIGFAELALLVAFLVGYQKRLVRGTLLALMGIACIAPARFYPTPFDDHILLYFARFPALAVIFMLYYLRDRDTLWSLGGAGPRMAGSAPSHAPETDPRLPVCLALIRFAVFFDLLMWNMDKFFHPLQTSRIFRAFYNIGADLPGTEQLSYAAVYLLGALQLVLILAFVAALRKRFTYGLVFALHTVSTFAPWERFLDPLTSHTLLFLVSFPMLGGIGALYYLRKDDRLWTWASLRAAERSMHPAPVPLKFWTTPARVAVAAFIAASAYVLIGSAAQWRTQVDRGPSLVDELRARTRPAPTLQMLEPEWGTAQWTATYHSANCTFDHPDIDDCWEIHFIVWVPGLPNERVMEGERQVEAAWIVDGGSLGFEPDRNAREFFELADGRRYSRG